MAITQMSYATAVAIPMTLSALASSSTFLAGRESTQVDNTTDKYLDALVSGRISVGTTPTINTSINVYVWGSDVSLTTTAINTLVGTDGARTLGNEGMLYQLRLGASISVVVTTSSLAYPILPFSVASLFGGVMPKFWGLFVTQNTGVALQSTTANNNSLSYAGIKYDII
jgi:hypothetical protein